jgi:hypothetical protein
MEPDGQDEGSLEPRHKPLHAHQPLHHHEREPLDLSYRLVIRTVLWVIAAAVLVGLMVWWVRT